MTGAFDGQRGKSESSVPVLLREWSFGSAHVAVYGDSITTIVNPADIAVVFGKNNNVKSITLGKASTTADIRDRGLEQQFHGRR